MSVTITKQFLMQCARNGVSYTKRQFELLGVSYPPKSGWHGQLIGKMISSEAADEILLIGQEYQVKIEEYPAFGLFRDDYATDWTVLRFDGSCDANGRANATGKWSFCLKSVVGSSRYFRNGVTVSNFVTNNVSEWNGLVHALRDVEKNFSGIDGLLIEGDSQLVIQTLIGRWNSRKPELTKLRDECRTLLHKIGVPWHARWIPREENEFCDSLT
jgi:ribonuclease HI